MGSTVVLSSDEEDSDMSESEMEAHADKIYPTLKSGKLKVKLSPQAFKCPYCPNKKKPSFQYKDLLQHASGVGNSNSEKRTSKEKASHLALVKYLQEDLADSEAEPSSKRQKTGDPIQDCDQDEKLVCPWKGVVVNIPTRKTQDGRSAGESGSKLRDEYIQRGFNPTRVRPLWNHWGFSGTAIVDFNRDWNGLHNALLFDKAYQVDGHGKKDWLKKDGPPKTGLYAWIARADDYNGGTLIGEDLRKKGDLKTIAEVTEEEARKQQKLVQNLTQLVEDKKKGVKEFEELCSVKSRELKERLEEKEKSLQKHNRELNAIQERTMGHVNKIFADHERLKMKLELEKKKLELKGIELAKREAHNETERKNLSEDLQQNASKNSSLELASMEQQKADEEVKKLAEYQRRQKEELHEKIIRLERQRDQKQAIELEIEQLKGESPYTPPSSNIEMTTVPGQLVWEIVKRNNCFLVKQFGRGNAKVQFSKETNNLCNLNSYKHSGLANKKTVTIQVADKEQGVVLGTTKTKKQNKPKLSVNKSVLKKEFPRMAKAVANQVVDNYYRPDLKKAALARLSVISKGLRVAKSGPKRRNRQA